jgi:BirA family biotin operon repressor/biotin-[acetyl-CoA-carboxylase] ligase
MRKESPRNDFLRMISKSFPDPLNAQSLGGGPLRRAVYCFRECDSTNDEARALAERGEPHGALVVAEYQRAGRGRMGRSWQAPPGSSLLFSLLLRPPLAPASAQKAVMAVSLGVREGIRRTCGLPACLKWPNDILIGGKKAGGVLCELGLDGPTLQYLIVGAGVNVNFDPRQVEGIPPDATSIQRETGRPQPRAELLRAILDEIEPRYDVIRRGGSLRTEWARALYTLGRRVRVALSDGEWTGLAEAVGEEGALLLKLEAGTRRTILAGDVVHVETEDGRSTIDHR